MSKPPSQQPQGQPQQQAQQASPQQPQQPPHVAPVQLEHALEAQARQHGLHLSGIDWSAVGAAVNQLLLALLRGGGQPQPPTPAP